MSENKRPQIHPEFQKLHGDGEWRGRTFLLLMIYIITAVGLVAWGVIDYLSD